MALKYTTWKVTDEKELKLRLTSHQAATVEEKIGMNLLKIFMPEAGEEYDKEKNERESLPITKAKSHSSK